MVFGEPLLADGRLLPDLRGERDFVRLAPVTLLQIGPRSSRAAANLRAGGEEPRFLRAHDSPGCDAHAGGAKPGRLFRRTAAGDRQIPGCPSTSRAAGHFAGDPALAPGY